MPEFFRYVLYSVAKICQILGHSDAKPDLMEDCDRNSLVMHRENLNAVEACCLIHPLVSRHVSQLHFQEYDGILWKTAEGRSGLHKYDHDGESHCAGPRQ